MTLFDPSIFRGANSNNPTSTADDAANPNPVLPGLNAPKMFAFDGVFTREDAQAEVAAAALPDLVHAVVNAGNDACAFCFGHANLGKTRTMLGSDECPRDMGVVPTAIAWLYRAVKEKRARTNARFSLRVSAMEITSGREQVGNDLVSVSDSPC